MHITRVLFPSQKRPPSVSAQDQRPRWEIQQKRKGGGVIFLSFPPGGRSCGPGRRPRAKRTREEMLGGSEKVPGDPPKGFELDDPGRVCGRTIERGANSFA